MSNLSTADQEPDIQSPSDGCWHVVMAKAGHERCAISNLERAGIAVYYPEIHETKTHAGKKYVRVAGLFPGYFFARFNFPGQHRTVRYCRGVHKIVVFGQSPAVVEPELIEQIKTRLRERGSLFVPSFKRGELVRISRGPLAGFDAVFDSALPRKQRIVVFLQALYYQTKAVVEEGDIEKYAEAI